mgnify:CR=1 FL=1
MARERTQLNINIDPKLLLRIKSEAIKNGVTLTEFITKKLEEIESTSKNNILEERLSRIEQHLNLDKTSSNKEPIKGTIFTDAGAKNYGNVARRLFNFHLQKKALSKEDGFQELALHLAKLPYGSPELAYALLLCNHDLTGSEMTKAYRHGACAMRTALVEWSNDPLEDLNEAFLNAVITKRLN